MATQSEVAAHLKLTDRQIRNLKLYPGAPVPRGRAEWDIDAWRYFYIEYLRASKRDVSNGDDPDDDIENPEKQRELQLKNAERQERILMNQTKRRILAKRYAPIEIISVSISRTAVALRTRIDSWLPRLKQVWPDMPQEAIDLLHRELAAASNELADVSPDLSDYDIRDIESDLDRLDAIASYDADDGSGVGG